MLPILAISYKNSLPTESEPAVLLLTQRTILWPGTNSSEMCNLLAIIDWHLKPSWLHVIAHNGAGRLECLETMFCVYIHVKLCHLKLFPRTTRVSPNRLAGSSSIEPASLFLTVVVLRLDGVNL